MNRVNIRHVSNHLSNILLDQRLIPNSGERNITGGCIKNWKFLLHFCRTGYWCQMLGPPANNWRLTGLVCFRSVIDRNHGRLL